MSSRKRFLSPWKDSHTKPVIYHCVSRVVERRFVLGDVEREKFRTFMRMYENFTGCRVLTYCLMSNHIHILLEVPPVPEEGISDAEMLRRLAFLNHEAAVAEVAKELSEARKSGNAERFGEIRARHIGRMHNLSEFMKMVLQRFSGWFNRTHQRKGTLWEERFKSVIVESGTASRMMAAYIDLNPVRAGMVADPAEYRWCGYGESVGGGTKGNGRKAREGLVRLWRAEIDGSADAAMHWKETVRAYRGQMGMAIGRNAGRAKYVKLEESEKGTPSLLEPGAVKVLHQRIRYFTDGAIIGGKDFVNETFRAAKERFGKKRRNGARRMKGTASGMAGTLWSFRDLRTGIG